MAKVVEKERAIKLRKEGHSYNYIAEKLSVSKSTLSWWLSNIPYTPNEETITRIGKARARSGERKTKIKQETIKKAQIEAKKDLGELTNRDLFMLGLGIYIGEGAKTADHIRVINADPRIISLSISWFKNICGLSSKHFNISIHLYPDNDVEEALRFWEKITGIPRAQFGKTQIDKRKNKKMGKRGTLPYGTAHLSVRACGRKEFGVFLARKIKAWSNIVLDKYNKERA